MSSGGDGILGNITAHYRKQAVSLSDYDRMRSFLRDMDYTPDPDDPVIWKSMGNIFFKEKNYDFALKCYENAVEINHSYTDALYNIVLTYKILGQNDAAEKIFDYIKTIRKNGKEDNFKNNGYFLSKIEKKPESIKYGIIERKVGVPIWVYGFAAFFILYGAASQRLIGGIMWAILALGVGYLITKIWIKRKKENKFRILSMQAVVPFCCTGSSSLVSRISRDKN